MSKQSVIKSGKVVQFPGTQPYKYKGRDVSIHLGIWPTAKGSQKLEISELDGHYILLVSATSFERAKNLAEGYAEEMGICLEGG